MTHVLQPLDVGIFRPWKHWHNQAIISAIRCLNIEYTISSFLHDLPEIRNRTFQHDTIIDAFRDSGIWPVSFKAAQTKMRQYKRRQRRRQDEEGEEDDYQLPSSKGSYWETQGALIEWERRVPQEYLSPSKTRYRDTLRKTQILLARGSVQEIESIQIRTQFNEAAKRKLHPRKSIQSGGALTAAEALEKIRIKRVKEGEEGVRKATKAITDFKRRAEQALHRAGIDARRDERNRKKLLEELYKAGEIPDPLILVPIRDPEKNPTLAEQEALQPPPDLLQALQEAKALLAHPLAQAVLPVVCTP